MTRIAFLLLLHFTCLAQGPYKNLIMEGGGIKGIAYGGALEELEERGVLEDIIRVGGTSAGAIQACLLSLGYTAKEITDIIAETPVESFNDDGFVAYGSKRLFKKYGWFKGDSFLQTIEKLIAYRTGTKDLSFAELHKLASTYPFRDLYVVGVDLTDQQYVVFSHETYPNMRVADAVRISMSIPLYYRAIWLDKDGRVLEERDPEGEAHLFVDGGLLMNYPVNIFDHSKYISGYTGTPTPMFNEETLGFRLERCEQIDFEQREVQGLAPFEIVDFNSYLAALSNVLMRNVSPPNPRDVSRTVFINDMGISSRVRLVPEDEKKLMMLAGRQGVNEFLARQGSK